MNIFNEAVNSHEVYGLADHGKRGITYDPVQSKRDAAWYEAMLKNHQLEKDGKITSDQCFDIDQMLVERKEKELITDKIFEEIVNKVRAAEDLKKKKSGVCRIANRIPRSVSRKDAFKTAWRIVKNGGYEIKVAGTSFYNRQEALRRLTRYDPKDIHAILVPEFDNPYDSNAIAVKVLVNGSRNVYQLGYVPKTETAIVKAFLGTTPELRVIDGDIRGAKLRLAA